MLSFRKAFVLLAVVVAMAAVAGAQSFQCAVNAGSPAIARQEGVAEEVGQVLLSCTGGTPTPLGVPIPNNVNIQIYLNTQVTSRLLTDTGWSESLLMLDEPTAGETKFCGDVGTGFNTSTQTCVVNGTGVGGGSPYKAAGAPNVFQGKYNTSVPNSMTFNGLPLDAPGTSGTRYVRIVNVRANASAITSSSFIPGNITMFIAITGTGAPGIGNNAQQVVAYVQKGLAFSLRSADGSKALTRQDLSQCTGNNSGAPDAGKGCVDFRLRFSELFGTAFRPQGSAPQNAIGAIYNTESMIAGGALWPSALTVDRGNLQLAGLATTATRLMASFTNIPSGVRVFATNNPIDTSRATASRIDNTDGALKSGTTECSIADPGVVDEGGDPVSSQRGYTELTSAGTATWSIDSALASVTSDVDFGVLVVYSPTGVTPGTTATQVTGSYAPVNTQSPILAARGTDVSGGYHVPRFVSSGIAPGDGFLITPCRTNLLFTFVTNQAGFDTGLAISNTSKAPGTSSGFNSSSSEQSGPCTINYYGQTTGGGQAPDPQTSGSVPAGGQLVFTLSGGGGVLGAAASINPTPGFQGYVIAQCNFQYAHGFAFVSDLGASKLAEGYLALVMDSAVGSRTTSSSETLSN